MSDLSNWKAPPFPDRKVLQGRYCRLEPLDVAKHGPDIAAANLGADDVWSYLPAPPPKDRASSRKEKRIPLRDRGHFIRLTKNHLKA